MLIRAKLFLVTMLSLPAVALAQVGDATSDPVSLLNQILAAIQSQQWLLLVPLATLALVWVARVFLRKTIPWLATDAGGAVLGLVAATATAVLAAVSLPGSHTVAGIVVATFTALLTNQTVFALLKKLGVDLSVDPAPSAPAPLVPAAPRGFARIAVTAPLAGILAAAWIIPACKTMPPVVVDVLHCGENAIVKRIPDLTLQIVSILRAGGTGWQGALLTLLDATGEAGACAWAVVMAQIEGGLTLTDRPKEAVPADVAARAAEFQALLQARAMSARAGR